MVGVVWLQWMDEWVDTKFKEEAQHMNMNRASPFVFTRLELVLFITDAL